MIAALFVQRNGCYFDLPDVDPWDQQRDARLYAGPWPVVAHPPCARWCRLAGFVEARHGYKRGADDGCFESALRSVRTFGGVLEHPAFSDAFAHFGLPAPSDKGGWQRGLCGGWVCHVEQGRYGHRAKKATWLYAFGVRDLPSMRWGSVADGEAPGAVSWCGQAIRGGARRPRLRSVEASRTPAAFRDALIGLASGALVELQSARERSATPFEFRDALIRIAGAASI